jgi:hypothetical protein
MPFGAQLVQSQGGVRIGTAGAHLGRDPNRLHDLLGSRTLSAGQPGVSLDAVWALGDVSDGDGNELFRSSVESPVSENGAAELFERLVRAGGEFSTQGRQRGRGRVVHSVDHR